MYLYYVTFLAGSTRRSHNDSLGEVALSLDTTLFIIFPIETLDLSAPTFSEYNRKAAAFFIRGPFRGRSSPRHCRAREEVPIVY